MLCTDTMSFPVERSPILQESKNLNIVNLLTILYGRETIKNTAG